MIGFPPSKNLPWCVLSSWGAFYTGSQRLFFVLQPGEACGIECVDAATMSTVFIVQGDKAECSAWIRERVADEFDKSAPRFMIETDGKACCYTRIVPRKHVIWLGIPPESDAVCVFSLMAHEALHAAFAVMDSMAMKPDFALEEWIAYYVQWLCLCHAQSIGVDCPLTAAK